MLYRAPLSTCFARLSLRLYFVCVLVSVFLRHTLRNAGLGSGLARCGLGPGRDCSGELGPGAVVTPGPSADLGQWPGPLLPGTRRGHCTESGRCPFPSARTLGHGACRHRRLCGHKPHRL